MGGKGASSRSYLAARFGRRRGRASGTGQAGAEIKQARCQPRRTPPVRGGGGAIKDANGVSHQDNRAGARNAPHRRRHRGPWCRRRSPLPGARDKRASSASPCARRRAGSPLWGFHAVGGCQGGGSPEGGTCGGGRRCGAVPPRGGGGGDKRLGERERAQRDRYERE